MTWSDDVPDLNAAFGERLRQVRGSRGLSQDEVAREANVHPTVVGRLERGSREPRLSTILRMAHGLGVPPGELLDGLDESSASQK